MHYLVKKRSLILALKIIDGILPQRSPKPLKEVRKILLCNTAHIGDLINMSYMIRSLRTHFPNAKIGALVGPEGASLLPVDQIHTMDHYKHSRAPISFFRKWCRYIAHLCKIVVEIRREKYDVAFDTYLYIGNSALILRLTGIPWCIGFSSGGFGGYFTHPIPYVPSLGRIKEYYPFLLQPFGIIDPLAETSLCCTQPAKGLPEKFIVVHPGSGNRKKQLPMAVWREIIKDLALHNVPIWITGKGAVEYQIARELLQEFPTLYDQVDQFSLSELSFVFRQATLVISVDSMAAHLAVAVKTPCIQIFNENNRNSLWEINPAQGYICYLNERSLASKNSQNQLSKIKEFANERLKHDQIAPS